MRGAGRRGVDMAIGAGRLWQVVVSTVLLLGLGTAPAPALMQAQGSLAADPWHATGSMSTPRAFFTATLLQNGQVLMVGGTPDGSVVSDLSKTELYDPRTGTFTATGS